MKTAIPAILAVVLASGASAQAKAANNPQELINIEADWAKAAVARDAAALNRIVAADWHGQNHHGKYYDRAAMIKETVSGSEKLTSEVNHDLHVRFLGNDFAAVHGMDNESGMMAGKKVSEVYSWLDLYEKRGGHWVAIASQSAKVK
jgi:hypothetical protein